MAALKRLQRVWHFVESVWLFVRQHWERLLEVVILTAIGYYFDTHKDLFPWLVTWQSWAQNAVASIDTVERRADHVAVIEIDDRTYRERQLSEPTERRFVASLVRAAAHANAAVVVLDLNLVRDNADATVRKAQNAELLRAIVEAQARKPPVPVVAAVLLLHESGSLTELPNVIPDEAIPRARFPNPGLPDRPLVGYVNAPAEPGQVPLIMDAHTAGSSRVAPFWPLSLRAADAYDSVKHILPPATLQPAIRAARTKASSSTPRF